MARLPHLFRIHHFVAEKDVEGRTVWRYVFYGFMLFSAVNSPNSWQNVDTNRHYSDQSGGNLGDKEDNQKVFGGQILAYIGFYLALSQIHGAFKIQVHNLSSQS